MKNATNKSKPMFSLKINKEAYENLMENEYTKELLKYLTYSNYYEELNEKLKIKEYRSLVSVAELHIALCKTMNNYRYTLVDVQCSSLVYGILKDMIDLYNYPNDIRLITKCNSSIRELIDVTYKNINGYPLELRITSSEFPKDLRDVFNKFNAGAHGNIIESVRSMYDMYRAIELCVNYLNDKLRRSK